MDQRAHDAHEDLIARLVTAVGKYWICKRTPQHAYEAMECIGGSGVMEDSPFPRLYREAPVNAIWEGSGNVQCLDVLRALHKEPAVRDALFTELSEARGQSRAFDQNLAWLVDAFGDVQHLERRSRLVVERAAMALQGAALFKAGNSQIAEAFCEARLSNESGYAFGTLPAGAPIQLLLTRALPAL